MLQFKTNDKMKNDTHMQYKVFQQILHNAVRKKCRYS